MTQLSLSSLNDTVELQGTLERVVFHNEENGYTVFRVRPEGKDEVDSLKWEAAAKKIKAVYESVAK